MNELIGMGVALVTPFNIDGTVDYKSLRSLVEYNIQNGTDYLVISGTTGESVTINKEEKHKIIETVATVNAGRLPLVIGIGEIIQQQLLRKLERLICRYLQLFFL